MGGLGAIPFALIALGTIGVAVAYPYLGRFWDSLTLGRKRGYEAAENSKERFWYSKSTLDLPFYLRIFLGIGAGLAVGSLFGGAALFIAPIALGALSLASPLIFAALEFKFFKGADGAQHSISSWLNHMGAKNKNLFDETPHGYKTLDMPWAARLFNGTVAGAAICGALIALGGPLALPILAVATPLLFTLVRQVLPKDPKHPVTRFFSPKLYSDHKEREANYQSKKVAGSNGAEVKALKDNKHLAYTQWYIRLSIGALMGGLIALGLGFMVNPILAPIAVLATSAFFLAAQPLYKWTMYQYKAFRKGADERAAVGSIIVTPNPLSPSRGAQVDALSGEMTPMPVESADRGHLRSFAGDNSYRFLAPPLQVRRDSQTKKSETAPADQPFIATDSFEVTI